MKFFLLVFFLANLIFADLIQNKDDLSGLKFSDQFDKELIVKEDTKKLIITFSKQKGVEIKEFLDSNPNYLKKENAIYAGDLSSAPSFITSMFMIPKFKKYSFSMGIIKDEDFAKRFPKKEKMITVIELDNSIVSNIKYKKALP